MDYCKIGERIRIRRKELGLSQEKLAEYADISVTHMSHIETGNTKLSLPVLVRIATALNTTTDELLRGNMRENRGISIHEIAVTLEACTDQQIFIIADLMKAAKSSLDKCL